MMSERGTFGVRRNREVTTMRGLRSGIGAGHLALVMFVALTAGCERTDERPILWFSGEVEPGATG